MLFENPNIEIRNPKQYQNLNVQNSKQDWAIITAIYLFWSFEFWSFEFVSSFEIRISCFLVLPKRVKSKLFSNMLFCHFRMQNL